MTMNRSEQATSSGAEGRHQEHEMHDYAGGYIQASHRGIPLWLLAVYVILLVWGLYYAYAYWGGWGPGLAQ
jgi:hypothetical protein